MKRVRFNNIDGEVLRSEEPIAAYCDCISGKLQPVPTDKDDDGQHTCEFCDHYVIWTNQDEISNNGRR